MDFRVVLGLVVIVVVLALFALHSLMAGTSEVHTGGTVLNVMGMPISLNPVAGKDVPCIGAPTGYSRVFFEDESGMDPDRKVSITVGYARQGDHLDEALDWIKSKASTCGFRKASEQSASFPGVKGVSLQYSKKDNIDLVADVGLVVGSDGKKYTLIRIEYDEYNTYEEEEPSSPPVSEAPQEVSLPQNVQGIDNEIRPVLLSVFGSAYPTEYANIATSYNVVYQVGRYTTSDDAVALSNALEERGWNVVATNNDGSIVEIGATRNNIILQISFDLNTKKVDVLWVVQE